MDLCDIQSAGNADFLANVNLVRVDCFLSQQPSLHIKQNNIFRFANLRI
jgi:hypothetical protein